MMALKQVKQLMTPFQWLEVVLVIGFTGYFAIIDQESSWWYLLLSAISAICGIFCVVLCAAGRKSQYYWGFANIMAYILVAWLSNYYGEVMLNALYYLPTQFIGLYFWQKHYHPKDNQVITQKMSWQTMLILLPCIGLVIWGYHLVLLALGGHATWLDSASTSFSLIANALMVMRYREQWLLWIVVDIITLIMWLIAGDWIQTSMWTVYLLNACYGLMIWSKRAE
jgi:nicotinamide mononucleotide transporter